MPISPIILRMKHLQQRRHGECLAACAAMVLAYIGVSIPYHKLLTLLEVRANVGTPSFKIRNLERSGIHVLYQRGSLEQLRSHLTAGQPCIVFVKTKDLPYRNDDTAHAIVLVGVDDQSFYVDDPEFAESPLTVPFGDFDLAWLEHDEMYAVLTR